MTLINDFKETMRILLNPKSEKWLPHVAVVAGECVCLSLIIGVTADAITKSLQDSSMAPAAIYLTAMSGLFAYIGRKTLALMANGPK